MNLSEKTLLITGVGEFIGLRMAEIAIARGIKVRGMDSSPQRAKLAEALGVHVTLGSVTDITAIKSACQGVDIILHTEELAKEGGAIKAFRQLNVEGTKNLLNVAKTNKVGTFIYLSSGLVYGFNYGDRITEDVQLTPSSNPYCQTKLEAEQLVLQQNHPPDFGVIVIRAGDVYGAGCIPWVVRPLQMMQQKQFAYADNGRGVMNHVYVDNLIDAIFLTIEQQAYGEIFNITDGQDTSWKEYFDQLANIGNYSPPFSLGKEEIKLFLKVRSQGQKLLRKEVDILPESIDFMSRPYAYSITKAQTKLKYEPKVSLSEGMGKIQAWLKTVDISKIK